MTQTTVMMEQISYNKWIIGHEDAKTDIPVDWLMNNWFEKVYY